MAPPSMRLLRGVGDAKTTSKPAVFCRPGKRSGTPEHMLSEAAVEMRAMPRLTQSPTVSATKVSAIFFIFLRA